MQQTSRVSASADMVCITRACDNRLLLTKPQTQELHNRALDKSRSAPSACRGGESQPSFMLPSIDHSFIHPR
jgi:hypothetical protein